MIRSRVLRVLSVIGFLAASAVGLRAEVFAMSIGIDEYGGKDDLYGAVADARDVAQALRGIGVRDVVLLLNGEARRERIFAELRAIGAKARSGDTIVLHYAGHGAQEQIRAGDPDPDGDGRNENFVLGGYRVLADPGERVLDKEIVNWLAETGRAGIHVLFIADSCHSGGMIRAAGPGLRTRKIEIAPPGLDSIARNVRSISRSDPALANATFIAAVPRNREAPEIIIDGQPRGALSWAFARALEGAASPAGSTDLTQAQLHKFIVPTVIALSEGQQLPQMFPIRGGNVALLPLPANRAAGAGAPQGQAQVLGAREIGGLRPVLISVTGGAAPAAAPRHVRFATPGEAADLLWDIRAKTLSQRLGGIVAENVEVHDIEPIAAKWAAIDLIKRAMGAGGLEIEIASGLRTYGRGDEVRINIGGAREPYLTIFNLPPNGRVELLYPDPANRSEARADWRGRSVEQKFFVDRPPFGAEHLVAFFSREPLTDLHAALTKMSDRQFVVELPETLREALSRPGLQAGVMPVYTAGR